MTRRTGLGRGLGALIPSETTTERSSVFQAIPLHQIQPNSLQPRKYFDEEAIAALSASIRELGVLQPVLVRPISQQGASSSSVRFELIAGERRWRAARRAGLQSIPALVQEVSELASLEQALVENLHRTDLNPLEEAAAYRQLIEDFSLTHDELARRVGKSRAAISNTLRLIQLPTTVQRFLQEGHLSAGHARALLGTPDRAEQERLARRAAEEGWSVRAVEEAVRSLFARDDDEPGATGPALERHGGSEDSGWREPSLATALTDRAVGDELGELGDASSSASDARASLLAPRYESAPSRPLPPPGILELEQLLADRFSTRVRVDMGARHGRVVVEFATLEDLERIYRLMVGP
jgi:ParB family chromosome partitioning protein